MSEHDFDKEPDNSAALEAQDLEAAKAEADRTGVKYHPSAKAETIRKKIAEHVAKQQTNEPQKEAVPVADEAMVASDGFVIHRTPDGLVDKSKHVMSHPTKMHPKLRRALKMEALELIRIKITCMNPAKKEMKGDFFTFQNALVGTVRKFVPFNTAHADAYHVPRCIYDLLQSKKFQSFSKIKSVKGVDIQQGRLVKEYAIEILPKLNKEELNEIAKIQRAMGDAE